MSLQAVPRTQPDSSSSSPTKNIPCKKIIPHFAKHGLKLCWISPLGLCSGEIFKASLLESRLKQACCSHNDSLALSWRSSPIQRERINK
jgi:hypothetical protein